MRIVNGNMARESSGMQMKQLKKRIQEYDFAIVETSLFLDTHPHNKKALAYYSKLRKEREKLVAEYENNKGPMTIHGNMNEQAWDWVKGPWPWEGEN